MGLALGCIGLSRSDFFALTPEEFNACLAQWQRQEENLFHASWEQARLTGYLALLPYAKKGIKEPQDLFRFAWEIPLETNNKPTVSTLTAEEFATEFERVAQKYG